MTQRVEQKLVPVRYGYKRKKDSSCNYYGLRFSAQPDRFASGKRQIALPPDYATLPGLLSLAPLGTVLKEIQDKPDGTIPEDVWRDALNVANNLMPVVVRKAVFQFLKRTKINIEDFFNTLVNLPVTKGESTKVADKIVNYTERLVFLANEKNSGKVVFEGDNQAGKSVVTLDEAFSHTQAGQLLPFALALQGYQVEIANKISNDTKD